MGRYGMRLIKIFNENADLTIENIAFENAGISDDVDYNPVLAKHLENSEISATTSSEKLERILLDPSIAVAIMMLVLKGYTRSTKDFVIVHKDQLKCLLVQLVSRTVAQFSPSENRLNVMGVIFDEIE